MDEMESLSHTNVGAQIPCGVHPEVPQEDIGKQEKLCGSEFRGTKVLLVHGRT